jgi:hypothetical protein
VATLEGSHSPATIFAFEQGDALVNTMAPARRVGLFLFDSNAEILTPQGWSLFDAAVRWAGAPP